MKFTQAIAIASAAGAIWFVGAPAQAQSGERERIECRSSNYTYRRCDVRADRQVTNVTLTQRLSTRACSEGSSWGWDERGVWVDNGCRAYFDVDTVTSYAAGPNGAYGGPNGGPGAGGYGEQTDIITCFAAGAGRTTCPAGRPISVAQLDLQRSTAPCIFNQSWGTESDGVWVSNGCGGDFRVSGSGNGVIYPNGGNGVYSDPNDDLYGGNGYPVPGPVSPGGGTAYDVSRELWAQRGFSDREVAVAACTRRIMQAAWSDADYAAMYDREPTVRATAGPATSFNPNAGGFGQRYWEVSGTIMVHNRGGFEPWTTTCQVEDGVVVGFTASRLQ